uniref:MULE domain-containing protein n=1 Tax=Cacopsylla melanoneura TaxID=428564 RepID=A0A8D8UTE6_9HEMI
MFFGLPFLVPNVVEDCFSEDIMSIQAAENSAVVQFCDYVLDNYIDVHSNFPPHIWAEFSCNISRTTNACESFHSKLNSMFYHPHPNIFKLVEALGEVQTMSNIKIKSTQRKIRRSK